MPLVSFDITQQCVRRALPCMDASSDIVLLSRLPLYVSLQQCIDHVSPYLVEALVSHVQVVTMLEESKTFGLLVRCISATAASNLVAALDDSVGPSTFSELRLSAMQVVGDVMPIKQGGSAPSQRRGNSPLLHPESAPVCSICLDAADALSGTCPGPSTFSELRLSAMQVVGDVMPIKQGGSAPSQRRGNSPLLHPESAPVCSICLDAADALSGTCPPVITTICAHTFHLNCIAKCSHGEPCPLCRFDMLLLEGSSECSACGGHNDLWMCLVCGAVNCGRNKLGHAFEHYRTTTHSHACQVGGSRVWDYESDAFVHHLALPDEGGAPVPAASAARWCDDDDEMMDEVLLQSKIEVVNDYYSRILNSQLAQQQRYFEGMLSSRSVQSILQLEHVERVAIMRQAAYEFKGVATALTSTMKTLLHIYQKKSHQLAQQRDFLSTTLAALNEGNDKLQHRVESFKPTASTASNERITELEKEVEKLIMDLSK
ncbi:BRCA1-associated protein, putative [Bodo saltans]|uniref:BRCA1-associated protein, putative n=1 Tax=Bodo saltans TaxID=75058 RepID=A0A0S4J708_BODSA|nr:BRCA1-associated protein, putative [Bodo saltans]|eukprot:CUG85475.1 BRCA1-associated protein, putative [Bodo saltans]